MTLRTSVRRHDAGRTRKRARWGELSFGARLAVASASLVTLTSTGVTLLADRSFEALILPAELSRFAEANRRTASDLARDVERLRGDVVAVLGSAAVQGTLRARRSGGVDPVDGTPEKIWRERLASLFVADLEARPEHLQVRLIGLDDGGRELVRVDRSEPGGRPRVVGPAELQRKGHRDYVARASTLTAREVFVSPIELNREHGRVERPLVPVLRAATPVIGDDGSIHAVVVINQDMRPSLARVRAACKEGSCFVLAERGDYLVHPDPRREFGSDLGRPTQWREDFPEQLSQALEAQSSFSFASDGDAAAASAVQVASGSRVVVLQTLPRSLLAGQVDSFRRSTMTAGGMAVCIGVALSWLVARSLTRPIRRITSAVESFTGSEPIEAPTTAGGEIGVLARAFEGMTRDVVRSLAALHEAEERFRLAVEASASGLIIVDDAGSIVLVNSQAERMFGWDREALDGHPLEMLVPERLCVRHARQRAEYADAPEARPMGAGRDLFARRKDGSEFPVEIGLSPFTTPQGARVLATVIDISARRRNAQRLESYARRLEKSNADLEQFAYVVSHDLKAPLRGISSVATWLAHDFEDSVTPDQRENLKLMLDRTQRLGELIDGILAYSRIGRQKRVLARVDSHAIVSRVVSSIPPPAEIALRIEGTLPSVVYDETQLHQVFQNLIDNAVKHFGKDRGEIVVASERVERAWRFAVSDTGVGIPERHLERIFGLFQTLRSKDVARSTGLGLTIVKRIVEDSGGEISVISRPGEGSSFRFTVPDRPPGTCADGEEERA